MNTVYQKNINLGLLSINCYTTNNERSSLGAESHA